MTDTRDPFRMVPADEFESYVRDMKKNENFGFDQQFKVYSNCVDNSDQFQYVNKCGCANHPYLQLRTEQIYEGRYLTYLVKSNAFHRITHV